MIQYIEFIFCKNMKGSAILIKLIATDLDGTLMSPDHLTVTPRTVSALKAAHDKGVRIAIATGRPMALVATLKPIRPISPSSR